MFALDNISVLFISVGNSCRYKVGEWGPCDPTTQRRTKVLTLVWGNAIRCKPTKEIHRKCLRPDGRGTLTVRVLLD